MSITLNDSLKINAPKHIDAKYMKFSGGITQPYANLAEALVAIPSAYRYQYLTVLCVINGDPLECWWFGGTADAFLQTKNRDSYILNSNNSVTLLAGYMYTKIVVLPTNNLTNLIIGTTSGGTDIEPGIDVTAGGVYTSNIGIYAKSNINIFLGGITTGTKVLLYKSF
jgi:hypothetical protein